ncbi:MAG: hypothetical protein AVDCRST_MAG67-1947, partial [uncultured Solirubrobacteraceae bacterium]
RRACGRHRAHAHPRPGAARPCPRRCRRLAPADRPGAAQRRGRRASRRPAGRRRVGRRARGCGARADRRRRRHGAPARRPAARAADRAADPAATKRDGQVGWLPHRLSPPLARLCGQRARACRRGGRGAARRRAARREAERGTAPRVPQLAAGGGHPPPDRVRRAAQGVAAAL